MHPTPQLEDAESSVTGDQLTQGEVDCLTLGSYPGEPLGLAHDLIIYLDVRAHTP